MIKWLNQLADVIAEGLKKEEDGLKSMEIGYKDLEEEEE